MANESYTCADIEVLEGLEPVRRRPGMYIGDVHDGTGLHHMLWEVVANVMDLHLARRAAHLRVDVIDGWVEVEDDGPGMPVGIVSHLGRRAADVIMTTLHVGATWDGHHPHVHLVPAFGVGLAAVNAVSAELELETRSEGRVWRQRYQRGIALGPLSPCGAAARSGTRLRWRPDPQIFSSVEMNLDAVRARLLELACLNPALTIRFGRETFTERSGLLGWVRRALGDDGAGEPSEIVATASGARNGVVVDVALGWKRDGRPGRVVAFANQMPNSDDSAHVRGFWDGIRQALADRVPGVRTRALKELLLPGLFAVVHVTLLDPRFGSPIRERLENPEAREATREVVAQALRGHLERETGFARNMCEVAPS